MVKPVKNLLIHSLIRPLILHTVYSAAKPIGSRSVNGLHYEICANNLQAKSI